MNRYWVWEAGQVPWQSGKWHGPWGQSKSWLEYILMNKLKCFSGFKMGLVGVTNSIRGLWGEEWQQGHSVGMQIPATVGAGAGN